jgi:hypothetical protein
VIPLPVIPLRALLIGGAVLAALLAGWWALDSYGDRRAEEGRVEIRADWAAQREVMEQAAERAEAEHRQLEYAMADQKQEAQRARENERAANARAADQLRAHERLRDAGIAAYAAGGGEATADSVAACRGRAAELGAALGEALSAHGECTATAVDLAADLRAVLAAWPMTSLGDPVVAREQ